MTRALRASALALGLAAHAALAAIPAPETIARAAADASRAQGRARAFSFALAVRPGGAEPGALPIAEGELLVDPAGKARLELRHQDGFVERQLRTSGGLVAARDAAPLESPHPLAPPLWPLLASTGGGLLAQLGELGGDPAQIALGHDGERDCYVLGGKQAGASIWVDKDTQQVARVDLADGTRYRFLAWATRGGALLPGRIEIETPALGFVLELTSAAPATPAADAFAEAWLGGAAQASPPPAP
jgi:hypothetical protein